MSRLGQHRRCAFTKLLRLFALFVLVLLGSGAAGPSWHQAPPPDPRQAAIEAPPWPAGWGTEEGLYAVAGGDPADRGALREVARHAEEAVPRIAAELAIPTGRRLRIYLVHTERQFKELQPGSPEPWADATAWPTAGLIFLRAPRLRAGTAAPLTQVLDHEITHALIGQRFHGEPVPRWLHEGLAQLVAQEIDPDDVRDLARGSVGGLLSLDELVRGFPEDPLRARLAYVQSADLLAFIRNRHGWPAVQALVRQLAGGTPVRAAIREATGEGLDEIDVAWRARLQSSQLWFPAIVRDGLGWALGGLLLVGGWLRIRRRNRARRAALEREEALRVELERAWLERQPPGADPEPPLSRTGRDGWAHPAPARPAGWLTDERLAEGLDADSERDPRLDAPRPLRGD